MRPGKNVPKNEWKRLFLAKVSMQRRNEWFGMRSGALETDFHSRNAGLGGSSKEA